MSLRRYLQEKQGIKLVCGAGNENTEEVEKLVAVYAAAGCHFFDLSANQKIIEAAQRGLRRIIENGNIDDYYLCVSIGLKGDPHISKAAINKDLCTECGACKQVCEQNAVTKESNHYKIIEMNCIGCKKCFDTCKFKAISFNSTDIDLRQTLPPLIKMGIHCIELHALGENDEELEQKWQILNEIFGGILSICLDRSKLGNEQIIRRIKKLIKHREPYSTIVQADGKPMSGSKDDFRTTLQTVAFAEIIQNENLPIFVLLSGGTNSKTVELANLCSIETNCIAIGSFARQLVRKYIDKEDFWENKSAFDSAVRLAKNLISKSSLNTGISQ